MRTRLVVLIAAGVVMLLGAAAPAQAGCGYNPCAGAQYGYQYAQPYYQQQYYQQPYQQQYYQQPPYYPQPSYQQPADYPQTYAQPCCRSHFGVGFGARNCCAQQAYAQPVYSPPLYAQPTYAQQTYVAVAPRGDWASYWASSPSWSGSNYAPIRLEYEGAVVPQVEQGVEQNYAYANPAPFPESAETYVQPTPHWYRKHVYRARPQTRVIYRNVYRNVYRTRVIHAKPRPHVLVPGNPSTSASTYEVAPRKVLRP